MLKKRIVLIIVSIFLLLNISCSERTSNKTDDEDIETGSGTPTISIYLSKYDKFFDDALWTYDGVSIKAKYYTTADRTEFFEKMRVELLAGEGPDIIKIDYGFEFPSVQKLFWSGVLTDLNALINEDTEFRLDNYNKVILNSGVSDEKRYLIPTGFIVPYFYSTRSIMEKSGINIDINNWTWDTMVQIADDFHQQNRSTGKYLFQYNQPMSLSPILFFNELLSASGFEFIDYISRKSYFNSPEFIEFLETYKEKICPVLAPENLNAGAASDHELFKEGNIIMLFDLATMSPEQLSIKNKEIQNKFNEEIRIFPIPSYKGGSGIVAQSRASIGINAKCKYKKAAFEFIKNVLSNEHHKQHYSYIHNVTVNNEALSEEKNYYSVDEPNLHFPKNLSNSFDSIMTNVNKSRFKDFGIFGIYMKEVEDYLKGKKTAKQTAKIIDQKAVIFLNE